MASEEGPWGSRAPEPPPRPPLSLPAWRMRGRLLPWLLFLAALAALIVALLLAYPEAMRSPQDWSGVAYYALFLVLLAAGAFRARQGRFGGQLKAAVIWLAIGGTAALIYAYREELAGVPERLRLAFSTERPVAVGQHELVIPQDEQGAFAVIGKVNGQKVRFIIDTGSSETVLAPADARRLGVDLGKLRYIEAAETANGKGYGAPYLASRLEVGPIGLENVRMVINQAPMTSSLLGLDFLDRLDSFQIKGRSLYLKWGDRTGR